MSGIGHLICVNVIWLPPSFLFSTGVQVMTPDKGKADDMTVEQLPFGVGLRKTKT